MRDSAVLLDATRGPGVGDTVIAAAAERPYADEVGADPGRLRIGLLDRHPRGEFLHDDCVAAVRAAAVMLEGLGHDVAAGRPRRPRRRVGDDDVHGAVGDADGDGRSGVRRHARAEI